MAADFLFMAILTVVFAIPFVMVAIPLGLILEGNMLPRRFYRSERGAKILQNASKALLILILLALLVSVLIAALVTVEVVCDWLNDEPEIVESIFTPVFSYILSVPSLMAAGFLGMVRAYVNKHLDDTGEE